MPERSRTPKRTTGEATRKKKKRPGQRVRVVEDVYTPRIWVWCVMILLLLELIGFCTCQLPSRGWYYRRRLIDYLSMIVIPSCWQLVPSLSLHLSMTVIPFYRQLVSSLALYLYMKIGPFCRQMLSSLSSFLCSHPSGSGPMEHANNGDNHSRGKKPNEKPKGGYKGFIGSKNDLELQWYDVRPLYYTTATTSSKFPPRPTHRGMI